MPHLYKKITALIPGIFTPAGLRPALAAVILVLASSHALLAQRDLYTYTTPIDPAWNGIFTWTLVEGGGDLTNAEADPYVPIYPESGDVLHIMNNITVYLHDDITGLEDITIILYNGGLDFRTHELEGID